MKQSYFFVIEGVDGSGKSSVIEGLHNHLFIKDKRFRLLTTREPTMGSFGKKIRAMLKNDIDPKKNAREMLELFIQDRTEHQAILKDFMKNVKGSDVNIILCDRYYHSTMAFQSVQGIAMEEIIRKNDGFLVPDCTFILDLEPKAALSRIQKREKEKFEQLEFMQKLRKQFLMLPKLLKEKIVIVDASKDINSVLKVITKEVDTMVNA